MYSVQVYSEMSANLLTNELHVHELLNVIGGRMCTAEDPACLWWGNRRGGEARECIREYQK